MCLAKAFGEKISTQKALTTRLGYLSTQISADFMHMKTSYIFLIIYLVLNIQRPSFLNVFRYVSMCLDVIVYV